MTFERAGAAALLALALAVAVRGQPTLEDRLARRAAELDARLAAREPHLDPGELLELVHARRAPLRVLDLRDEPDWNRFHLRDARRTTLAALEREPLALLPGAVVVVASNDEARAEAAWRRLVVRGVEPAYVLAGGVNLWLEVFARGRVDAAPAPDGDDRLRHALSEALGGRWPAARPPADAAAGRVFERKVRATGPRKVEGGGCG